MTFKEITQYQYLDCKRLLDTVTAEQDLHYSKPSQLLINNYYFDNNEPLYKIFGAYDEYGVLNACVFLVFSEYDRSYYVRYVAKQPFSDINVISQTLDFAISYAESNNYHRWYVKYFGNDFNVFEKIFSKSDTMSRYEMSTEEFIPAGKKSSFLKYWIYFQGTIIYKRHITIRQYNLPDKFRTNKI